MISAEPMTLKTDDPLDRAGWLKELAGLSSPTVNSIRNLWDQPLPVVEFSRHTGGLIHLHWNRRGIEFIHAPEEALQMGGRLAPLIYVSKLGVILLSRAKENGDLYVQFHDEEPSKHCLHIDAPLNACKPADGVIPDPYCLGSRGFLQLRRQMGDHPLPPWRNRQTQAIWRGATTDAKQLRVTTIESSRRYQLCRLSKSLPHLINARITDIVQCASSKDKHEISNLLQMNNMLSSRLEPLAMAQSRWIIDIDGNVNSWGLLWKLLTGSCVIRVTSTRGQWFHEKLKPYIHMVPVQSDLSNLEEQIYWCHDNEEQCEEIAREGQLLAFRILEDLGIDLITACTTFAQQTS